MSARRTLAEHLEPGGPKRILACDGGGIRGVFTLHYLKKIETMLRERSGDPELVLSDYFDLVGGTSTGSIIASGIAMGRSIDWLLEQYRLLADEIFAKSKKRFSFSGLLAPKFTKDGLRRALEEFFDVPIGSEAVKTGLMIMCRRADTGSPWALHNNPRGKYYAAEPGANWIANKDFMVSNLVASSAAAPTYFEPEEIQVGIKPDGQPEVAIFVDGGVSPYNNPALQLLMLATLEGYGFNWPMGEEKILLVSVGTGSRPVKMTTTKGSPVVHAVQNLTGLMDDCAEVVEAVLQWLGRRPDASPIDSEMGDLQNDIVGGAKQLHYLRYNVQLDARWMKKNLELDRPEKAWENLHAMDKPENVAALEELGAIAADRQIKPEHFPAAFDL